MVVTEPGDSNREHGGGEALSAQRSPQGVLTGKLTTCTVRTKGRRGDWLGDFENPVVWATGGRRNWILEKF